MAQELLISNGSFSFLATDHCPIVLLPGDTIIVDFFLEESGGTCFGSLLSTAEWNGSPMDIPGIPYIPYHTIRITSAGEYLFRAVWQLGATPPEPTILDPEVRITVINEGADKIYWGVEGLRLQGAHQNEEAHLMRTSLLASNSLPSMEPYSELLSSPLNNGGESLPGDALLIHPYAKLVDWVHLELHTDGSVMSHVASTNALLLSNGCVRSAEHYGASVSFDAPSGTYYLRVIHRNHLPVTFGPFQVDQLSQCVDLTAAPVFGEDTRVFIGTIPHLRAGNALYTEGHQCISYAGVNNDRDAILQRIGGNSPTATVSGYYNEDVNLDGVVKYAGSNNDRDLILQSIGGDNPLYVVHE